MDRCAPFEAGKHITTDVPCASCGYNLRTLAVSGLCPECGRAVHDTLRYVLAKADPAWLRTLHEGAGILAWTAIASFVFSLCALGVGWLGFQVGAITILTCTAVAGFFIVAFGAAELTAGEPHASRKRWLSASTTARACPVAVFLFVVAGLWTRSLWVVSVVPALLLLWQILLAARAESLAKRGAARGTTLLARAVVLVGSAFLGLVLICLAAGRVVLLLLPSYGGAGRAILELGFGLLAPCGFVVTIGLNTVLMFRIQRLLVRSIESAEAAAG